MTEYPYQDVYNMTIALSAEQKMVFDKEFILSSEINTVIRRLRISKNNMIAIIGNQGIGKTTVKQNIYSILLEDADEKDPDNFHPHIYSFKWGKIDKLMDVINDSDLEREYQSLVLNEPKIVKKRRGVENLERGEVFSQIEATLSKTRLQELKQTVFTESADDEANSTFLIDFPDYDKKNHQQMINDLSSFRDWWDSVVQNSADFGTSGSEGMSLNIVVFFQKELWGTHFFDGKFDVVEIKPFTPDQLKDYYIELFGSTEPFTENALLYLAGLARGVVRWFKKYIRLCLDTLYNKLDKGEPIIVITVREVKDWITLDHLSADWDRELMDLLPKSRSLRRKAVKIIRLLFENGDMPQSEIRRQFFGDENAAEVACSRLIDKLEDGGYLTRENVKRENIIRRVTLT